MFQIFDTLKFYMCFICYDVFHVLLSWDSFWVHGMYICTYVCMYLVDSSKLVVFIAVLLLGSLLIVYYVVALLVVHKGNWWVFMHQNI
jgi:hypothetical protein